MQVLVADDDGTSRLLLNAAASKLGHDCVTARDGLRAWGVLSSQRVDVLFTDWMMPGLSGLELCRRVREELVANYVYIVLTTALGNPDRVLEGMNAGADDYLIKPVDPFTVQTRLVAAERVTDLHRKLARTRARLEAANGELLGRSLTDPLTGLGNRRRMEDELGATHSQAQRTGTEFSVALFDIDHFKLYNDRYGHLAGDEALRRVAMAFDSVRRSGERVYRYGGEEFLLILHACSAAGGMAAAERYRQAVASLEVEHDARPSDPKRLTLSGGVSSWTTASPASVPTLLDQADHALFLAKSSGRNRVQVAPAALEFLSAPV